MAARPPVPPLQLWQRIEFGLFRSFTPINGIPWGYTVRFQSRALGFQILAADENAPAGPTPVSSTRWVRCYLVVPHWFALLATSPLPILWIRGRMRMLRAARRQRAGHCLHCGYDLRAHAPGQKCPECGNIIPAGHSP